MEGCEDNMMQVSEDFYIKCNNCGYINQVDADSLDCDTATYERSMGEEIEYNFYGEICCERCLTWISFNVRGYEYPVGAYNFSDFDCQGGTFVSEPVVEIEYEFDEDYDNFAYQQYIEAQNTLERNREKVQSMSPREFELFVGDLFQRMGYSVKVTQSTRDGGCDIIATKAEPIPFTLIVECKHWKESHKVDVSVVRSVYGVQSAEHVNKSVIVTTSKFTKDARRFAEARKELMTLWEMEDLLKLIEKNYDGEI